MAENNPDGETSVDFLLLEDKLIKIRSQINSKLENQKNLALILSAVEENINDQSNEKAPTAYFVSFLSLLEQSVKDGVVEDNTLATSAAYFLDLVLPFTPSGLLKTKFGDILSKLAPSLTNSEAEAPLVRSTIGALESLLLVQDYQQWSSSGKISPKRALVGLLELSFDPRPKVRKRAQDAIHKVLSNPPASPSPTHIGSSICAELTTQRLASLVEAQGKLSKKDSNKDLNTQLIHTLKLVTAITSANAWPSSQVEILCEILLEVSKTSDQYIVTSAFSAFEGLFESMSNIIDIEKFSKVLKVIFDLKPSTNDTYLAAPWLAVFAKAMGSFATLSPESCLKLFPTYLPSVSEFLSSEIKDIYTSSSQCLIAIVSQTITDELLLEPTKDNNITTDLYELIDETVSFLAKHIESELLSIKYQHANKEILDFIADAISQFKTRCNPEFLSILEIVGEWRTNETDSFANNKQAEEVISASIEAMGPEVVLGVLPLNLNNGKIGRAWMLPLLRDCVRFSSLEFYKREILPLVEFFESKIKGSSNKNSVNIKIFQTIVDQIWSLLPHFCDLPKDLRSSFDDAFASNISNLIYSNVELRVPVCNALKLLVESNLAYSKGALNDDLLMQQEFPAFEAIKNIEYLGSKASNVLSVLFNVFSSTLPDSRGYILEAIDTYLQIIPKPDLEVTFNKVCSLLKDAMDQENGSSSQDSKNTPQLSATMMDLVVAMAKYVPPSSHNALLTIYSSTIVLKNALIQKRSYRIINKLLENEEGVAAVTQFMGEIETVILSSTDCTQTSARSSRLATILSLLDLLPTSDLYFIPSILQEVIMSTKDVNEKTRGLSYQILTTMGHKMEAGGIIDNSKVPGFENNTAKTTANLTEYFTMVSAGLAAQTPHMISATITALSCLVFEFKDALPVEVLLEIASTVELFLTHNSREIAKSAIGFVKVEVLSLPEDIVRPNLPELLSKLMRWSHEHKEHFKSKVKHILERLIRKFGVEEIEQAIPEEDKKLVVNIRKSRDRAKRKQLQEPTGPTSSNDKKFVSAYEQALYDSEDSADDGSDDEDLQGDKKRPSQFIMEDKENPLNLLDRLTLAHISSSKPKKGSRKDLAAKNNVQTKNGKLVFDGISDNPLPQLGSGIDAYLDAVKQAPVRGQKNRLKFKKNRDQDDDDVSDSDNDTLKPAKFTPAKNRASQSKISKPKRKFKAKKKL